MYIDDCRLKGVVNLVLRDKDGKVKQHKTIRNKVTRAGIAHIIGRMIDDGQDRSGLHQMPRMMSHMAVGIGASARDAENQYHAKDYDSLSTSLPGQRFPSGTTLSSRKRAASAESYDRMLQDERGYRVQLMKDTTLATDYSTLQNAQFDQEGSTAIHSLNSSSKSQLVFLTSSLTGTIKTVELLRKGLRVSSIGTTSGSLTDISSSNIKIDTILSGSPTSTTTTVTLDQALPVANQPGASSTEVFIDFDYVDRIELTSYSTGTPNHPTHTHVQSVFEPNTTMLGPFGAASTRGFNAQTDFSGGEGPYTELGKAMLGVTRGRIGAFYERELEYNINLIHTDSAGAPIDLNTYPTGNGNVATTVQEAGFAKLDGTGSSATARFPFVGDSALKPSGIASVGVSTVAGTNTASTRGTEFVQFGTSVDGIFQGELVGSSLVANDRNGTPEGYPPEENNYGSLGGLTVTNNNSADALGSYLGSTFLSYDWAGGSYTPNAQAGTKKNGDRIVYVATFKENNPRPETDYEDVYVTSPGTTKAPYNRVYPICEAGIFNKHIKDIGIFDVGNRAYTVDDTDSSNIAHIDTRLGITDPTSGSSISLGAGDTTSDGVNHAPTEILDTNSNTITASAYGFTQGPITQTMLCRTTFDPINKGTSDTLQITWSIQVQDS